MTRETSIEVFRQIKDEGLLSDLRQQVYEVVFNFGPLTNSEAAKFMRCQKNLTSGRMTELRDLGVIRETGKRLCKITGRKVLGWEITGELPIKRELRLTDKEMISIREDQICYLYELCVNENDSELIDYELQKIEGDMWDKKRKKLLKNT